MNGVDIVTVAELMGHKDLSMTKRYSHPPTPEHKKQAINSLNFNLGRMKTPVSEGWQNG
jgi:integrase